MKKLTWTLIGIIGFMLLAILLLLNNALSVTTPRIRLIERSINERDYTKFIVQRGTLQDIYTSTGEIVSLENPYEISTHDLSSISTDPLVVISKSIGEKFVENDLLYTVGGVEVFAQTNGKVIRIDQTTSLLEVEILNYRKLSVKTSIPQSLEPFITGLSSASVVVNNQTFTASIRSIGSLVVDGSIEVYLSVTGLTLLPGSSIPTNIQVAQYTNVSYVKSEYILFELGSHFIYLLSRDGKTVQKLPVVIVKRLQSTTIIQALDEQYYFREFIVYND
jgi:hypothetical protein